MYRQYAWNNFGHTQAQGSLQNSKHRQKHKNAYIRHFPLFLALFKNLEKCQKTIKIDTSWFNDMVLGWFNPHFNANTRMTSPEAVQNQEKQKYCIFVFL